MKEKQSKNIIRSVRIDENIDTAIKAIAEYEDRSVSSVIQRLLKDAIYIYLNADFDFVRFCEDDDDYKNVQEKAPHRLSLIPPGRLTFH